MGKLKEANLLFPQTQLWHDSCAVDELHYSIMQGGVCATTNPVIVYQVLKNNLEQYTPLIEAYVKAHPDCVEDALAWHVIKSMGTDAAALLKPIYEESDHLKGRISLQTNAKYYRSYEKTLAHATELAATFENVQIKAPTSEAGIRVFESLTYQGISINATVCFTVAQALAVGEAVERGLNRRKKEGLSIEGMSPVCTIMVGRVDDYLKKHNPDNIDETVLEQAGIAVFKKAYRLYQEAGFTTKLLSAAYRSVDHWSSFLGGDVAMTITYAWQQKIDESDVNVEEGMSKIVDPNVIAQLSMHPAFIQAYDEKGLQPNAFHLYGPFKDTMAQFLEGYDNLVKLIRPFILDPVNE